MKFPVHGDSIELIKLLKASGLAPSGGAARVAVSEGRVAVDGEVETRKRRQVCPGQVVEFDGEVIEVTGPGTPDDS